MRNIDGMEPLARERGRCGITRTAAAVAAFLLSLALTLSGCTASSTDAPDAQAPQEAASAQPATGSAIAAQSEQEGQTAQDTVADDLAKTAFKEESDGYETLADDSQAVLQENGGEPSFTEEDTTYAKSNPGYESYSPLDGLGRCGAATACLGPETMPAPDEEREGISSVKPSGWDQAFYDDIDGGALWNRCHLIAWSLADENANERNLVTGTRSMNVDGMLDYEEQVARYIDGTGNHVLYRATPLFEGAELVCRGVLLEAESLEDGGAGVSFAVVCVNVQPGVAIDYGTGASHRDDAASASPVSEPQDYVLNTSSKRFHLPDCGSVDDMSPKNRQYVTASREDLIDQGYKPCSNCQP